MSLSTLLAALVAVPMVSQMDPLALSHHAAASATQEAIEAAYDAARVTHLASSARAVRGAGIHPGFDTHSYPGDRAMLAFRAHYDWVGYYLPAPCHRDESWSGRREAIARMGWGVAVIFVGQQTWSEARPLPAAEQRERLAAGATCLPMLVRGDKGTVEANGAIARTAAEGFPAGTVIYLDLERMQVVPPRMRDYYRAWTARVLADGRYVPGVYVHTHNAATVHRDLRATWLAAGVDAEPPTWVAGGRGFDRDKAPHEVGHTFAHAWQGVIDVVERRGGFRLPVDVNVASVRSPSGVVAMTESDE